MVNYRLPLETLTLIEYHALLKGYFFYQMHFYFMIDPIFRHISKTSHMFLEFRISKKAVITSQKTGVIFEKIRYHISKNMFYN